MELPVKERLVGAAILVGLIVVLVPEMLSGPKDTETVGGTADDGAVRTYTIDLSAAGKTTPQVTEPQPQSLPEILPPLPETQVVPEPPKPQPSKPEPQTEPVKEVIKPVPERESTTPSPTKPSSGWAVQLGSFSSAANAKKLVTELRSKGFEAFISSTGSGTKARHRVRVGPVETRPLADKLAQRLKRDGRQVAVVSHP